MNKTHDDWVLVEKSEFAGFENKNYKTMFDEVKITSTGWAIINFTDLPESETNTDNNMSNTWVKEQKENECSQTSGASGPLWYDISLND